MLEGNQHKVLCSFRSGEWRKRFRRVEVVDLYLVFIHPDSLQLFPEKIVIIDVPLGLLYSTPQETKGNQQITL